MSEYWKSTPKYWCKFCKVYVRDTKLEKAQHEATGRHQGSIQKSLRDIHRGKDREERDKQRAKDEVARLNGLTSGNSVASSSTATATSSTPAKTAAPQSKKTATVEDRKRQMAQLAAMGIAIPEEFRGDMAMAGDWKSSSVKSTESEVKGEDGLDTIAKGVRKRKHDNAAEEEEEVKPRQGWGRQQKTYPGQNADVDLDALLKEPIRLKHDENIKSEDAPDDQDVKGEDVEDEPLVAKSTQPLELPANVEEPERSKDESVGTGIVFKKRKAKPIREK